MNSMFQALVVYGDNSSRWRFHRSMAVVEAHYIAAWDGSTVVTLGSGLNGPSIP